MDKQDLLLEIGCEELPTHAVKSLANELSSRLRGVLALNKFTTGPEQVFASPRRLAILINDVDSQQVARVIERQGPNSSQAYDSSGQPTQAALGFARSCGVELSAITIKDNRLYFKGENQGKRP